MMLLDEARIVLEEAGYRCRSQLEPKEMVLFEDSSVMGFAAVFTSVKGLLDGWRSLQSHFLSENAARWRTDHQKAWNLYAVILAEPAAETPAEQHKLQNIEDDLVATRKIARTGVHDGRSLRRALAPLLPIAQLSSRRETTDALNRKLTEDESTFLRLVLQSPDPAEGVAEWLTTASS